MPDLEVTALASPKALAPLFERERGLVARSAPHDRTSATMSISRHRLGVGGLDPAVAGDSLVALTARMLVLDGRSPISRKLSP
jgi:hypothetical protein